MKWKIFLIGSLLLLSFASAVNVASCIGLLNDSVNPYDLTQNITIGSDWECLQINNDSVFIDCHGYSIIGNGSGIGIFDPGFNDTKVINCEIWNWTTGIRYDSDTHNHTFYNDSIHNCSQDGMFLGYPAASCEDVNITEVHAYENNLSAIIINGADNFNISLSNLSYNVEQALHLSYSENGIIRNSTFNNNGYEAIYFQISDNFTFIGNDISNNEHGVFHAWGEFNTFAFNTISNNSEKGYYILFGDNNTLYNNTFNQSANIHILVNNDDNLIYYNNFYNGSLYYINNSGINQFNITVGGRAHGNYYDDILLYNISDTYGDGFGDYGSDYPYNATENWIGIGADWGPISPFINMSGTGILITPTIPTYLNDLLCRWIGPGFTNSNMSWFRNGTLYSWELFNGTYFEDEISRTITRGEDNWTCRWSVVLYNGTLIREDEVTVLNYTVSGNVTYDADNPVGSMVEDFLPGGMFDLMLAIFILGVLYLALGNKYGMIAFGYAAACLPAFFMTGNNLFIIAGAIALIGGILLRSAKL